jgi:hypothetical protein
VVDPISDEELTPPRSRRALTEQMALIERFIAGAVTASDAAAMGYGRGYSRGKAPNRLKADNSRFAPVPANQYAARGGPRCCEDCARPSPDHSQRFEEEIVSILDASPRYLHQLVWPAVKSLDQQSQMVLLLHCKRGLSFEQIVTWKVFGIGGLGIRSDTTAWRIHQRALEAVARLVWLDSGVPNWQGIAELSSSAETRGS